jgi:hypothetical protein
VPDVHFLGQVTDHELSALYDCADLFLCASEHEGFCVPVMEAFHKGVPVVAYAATAVPVTMDGGGVLYETRDPRRVASIVHGLLSDAELQATVLEAQDAALDRLRNKRFDDILLRLVRQALDAPRQPLPPVSYDFWRQFTLAEELEVVRQSRPAAFRALPFAPEDDGVIADLGHRA